VNHRTVFAVAGLLWWASLIGALWASLFGMDVRWWHLLTFGVMGLLSTVMATEPRP